MEGQFESVRFLKSLFKGCNGYLNIRILSEKKNIFVPLSQIGLMIPKIRKEHKGKDIYFAVATRKDGNGSKGGIINIPGLFCDLDYNGRRWKDVWDEFKRFRPRPTAVLRTGGGYHLHWFLKTPATIEEITKIESILKRLASYLGGDLEATDASRIMRIPGSVNLKPERKKYRARLIIFKPNRRYELSDFEFLPPVTEGKKAEGEILWAERIISEGVLEGERNDSITRLAGKYVGLGLSKIEVMPILLEANTRFGPPLDEKEVEKTLDSIIRTDSRRSAAIDEIYMPTRGEGRGLFQILSEPSEEPDYLIKPFLQAGDKGYLASSYKVGKTLFAIQITLSLSKGIPFLGFVVPKPRKVLFIRFELSWRRFKQSLRRMDTGLNPPGPCRMEPVFELERGFDILNQKDLDWLIRMIDKYEPALLILDPFYKMTNWDLRDTSSTMPLIRRFESVRSRYNDLCILINAHQIKNAKNDKDWDTTYGPMQFFADMDFEIRLRVNDRESKNPIFTLDHISNDENIEPVKLRRDPNTLLYYPDHSLKEKEQGQDTEFEKARQSLTAFIDKNRRKPNQTEFRKIIKDELGKSDPKARKIIEDGQDKYWKELSEGKGRATLYEPISDNSAQTSDSEPR